MESSTSTGVDLGPEAQEMQGHLQTFLLSELIKARDFFPASLPLISSLSLNSLLDTSTHAHANE